MNTRLAYVINPAAASGRAVARWQTARTDLWRRGLAGAEFVPRAAHDGVELARRAAADADILVAVGGDGTVSEVASGLLRAGAPARLAILPLGTANDLASQLGIRSLNGAIDLLPNGQTRRIDAIEVRCAQGPSNPVRHALSFVCLGFAGEVLRQTTPAIKRWFGPRWCYWIGFLRALATYRHPNVRVQADQTAFHGRWLHICAGNLEWAGGGIMRLSPGAQCADGLFDVCLIEAMPPPAIAWHFPKLLGGSFVKHPRARYFQGTELVLETEAPEPIHIDGDMAGRTPAHLSIRPRCLHILAPPSAGHS
ncbi:MAG TPA: diacylglycerol kinase family lipid kinase [Verrucomicrobiota bacterium]|nr:diacylglycerol kinase family lipid kinase [Verrucomicrobiota bacterium]OQC66017.1 MAG: Diacylglycerol kinase [Verrucomicrobia bacterium ADurb.Bin006]NMD21671.1 diacylglycerol kinase family lipid kinase [Verrucomicrobiota bacterium]HNU99723.1 diacylglycerol kinase family lipid kinase [Verrucomicrobiota bacterium]HOA62973.1 diacylglycerol kinase family lipid kinase [Verrucomicrobiota bacterium]